MDVAERRRDVDTASDREAQAVSLAWAVIGVLSEHQDLDAAYGVRWSAANTSSGGG